MAGGSGLGSGGFDVAALNAADVALDASEPGRGTAHVAQLKAVLAVHQVHRRAGLELSTAPYVASRLRCSEQRATELLTDASLLVDLPGAFALLETGVMTVEQSRALCRVLVDLDDVTQIELWERTARQLQDDRHHGRSRSCRRPRPDRVRPRRRTSRALWLRPSAMTLGQRLRGTDRKAGFYKQPTPEQWVRAARAWRSMLASACFIAALVVLFGYFVPEGRGGMSPFAFIAVFLAFQAGQQKVEYDRLRGQADSIGGNRRPEGF